MRLTLFPAYLAFTIIASLVPLSATAEALTSVSIINLFYQGSKRRVSDEEIKTQLEEVDASRTKAWRDGQMGEVRRQLSRGLSLIGGRGWSDERDFDDSLVVRTEDCFVDPARPIFVRLEQIYPSVLSRSGQFHVRAALHKPGRYAIQKGHQSGEKIMELGELPDVGLDLVEKPLVMQIDLGNADNGKFEVRMEFFDGDEPIGSAVSSIHILANLDNRIASLRKRAATAPEQFRADILYPIDFIRRVNLGRIRSGRFDIGAELTVAESVANDIATGKDPFLERTGDFERHYNLADTDEIMPYRIYVPKNYTDKGQYPLIVALHGLGGNEDSMFSDFYGMPALAEERGYILVAPMGFRVDGGYGAYNRRQANHKSKMSENDVMEVLNRTLRSHSINPQRIYLMGHSMGAIGTWAIATRTPDIWAALGPIAGWGDPDAAATIKHIPQIVVHGDADRTVNVSGSDRMVEALEKAGAVVNYIKVPGGGHSDIAPPNMPRIFDFFDEHQRAGD